MFARKDDTVNHSRARELFNRVFRSLLQQIKKRLNMASGSKAIPREDPSAQATCNFLRTIPPEIRNIIYQMLADSEKHALLLRHLRKGLVPRVSLRRLLRDATAVHPLAMTCRQLHREFHGLYIRADRPEYVLVINNFDLRQIEYAFGFLDSICKSARWPGSLRGIDRYLTPDEVHYIPSNYHLDHFSKMSVTFHFNDNIAKSAQKMVNYIKKKKQLPEGLTTWTCGYSGHGTLEVNTFDASSEVVFNYWKPTMTDAEKKRALTPQHVEETRKIFVELERMIHSGRYVKAWPPNPRAKVVEWMKVVWAGPINRSVVEWEDNPGPNKGTFWSSF